MEIRKLADKIQILTYEKNERVKDDYDILEAFIINDHYEIIFANQLFNEKTQFVTWEHNLHNDYKGNKYYYNGHYFDDHNDAYRDFYIRAGELECIELNSNEILELYYDMDYEKLHVDKYDHNEKFEKLTDKLMPYEGKSNTVAGELLRAINHICYRFANDGDILGYGTGNETCNFAGRYIYKYGNRQIKTVINKIWDGKCKYKFNFTVMSNLRYKELLSYLVDEIVRYIDDESEELMNETPDMYDFRLLEDCDNPYCVDRQEVW